MPAAASVKLGSKRTCGVAASLTLALHRPSSLPALTCRSAIPGHAAVRPVRAAIRCSCKICEGLIHTLRDTAPIQVHESKVR